MVQKKLPTINSAHGSETRNIINELIKLFNGMGYTYDEALQKAHDVLTEAKKTNDMNKNVQEQINTLVAESGTSDAEVLQARGGFDVLNDRFEAVEFEIKRFKRGMINLAEYEGLNGDGYGLDTDFLQHAVDNYKTVIIPEPEVYYKIDKQIDVPSNTKIIGIGKPKIFNDLSDAQHIFNVVGAKNVKFESLDVRNGSAVTGTPTRGKDGFYFYDSQDIEVKDCYINEIQGYYGMSFEKCKNIKIHDNVSYRISRGHCLLWGEVENIDVRGNTFDTVTNTTVQTGSNYTYLFATAHHSNDDDNKFLVRNLTIEDNKFLNNPTWEGIDCHGGVNVRIKDNHIENVRVGIMASYLTGNYESSPRKHENIYIIDNTIIKGNGIAGGNGIITGGGFSGDEYVRANNIIVHGNNISGMGDATNNDDGAISIKNVDSFSIKDNTIIDYYGTGVSVRSDSKNGQVSENKIKNPGAEQCYAIAMRGNGAFVDIERNKIYVDNGGFEHRAGIRFWAPGLYNVKDNAISSTTNKYMSAGNGQVFKNSVESLDTTYGHKDIFAYDNNELLKFRNTDDVIRGYDGASSPVNASINANSGTRTLRLNSGSNLFHILENMEIVIPGAGSSGNNLTTIVTNRTHNTITTTKSIITSVANVIPYPVKATWIEVT